MVHYALPDTICRSWAKTRLATGDRGHRALAQYVMKVYAEPLKVYYTAFPDSRFVEADEAVHGFLADRLSRPAFLDKWYSSGKGLWRWLMTAFRDYIKEQQHVRRRDARFDALPETPLAAETQTPEQALDRAYVVSLVRNALAETRTWCEDRDLHDHWRIFVGHYVDGKRLGEAGADLGVTARRAGVMSRTVRTRFKFIVRGRLGLTGVAREDLDAQILALLD